jgi:hypothetical protein
MVSEITLKKKAVELHFLVLPCLKRDIQRPLVSNNGTMSEDVLQKLIYNYYMYKNIKEIMLNRDLWCVFGTKSKADI